jgi:hypothetical protein
MEYISRDKCVITEKKDLVPLYKLNNFPVFIGCTDQNSSKDMFAEMEWVISKGSGIIQLKKLLPLDIVYSSYHSEAVGGVWARHHDKFSDFVVKYSEGRSVVEMGGSNGALAEICLKKNNNIEWTIVEPNSDPNYQPSTLKISVINSFIEDQVDIIVRNEVFVHSHVLEHLYNPLETMSLIAKNQNQNNKMIFSIPDLYKYLNEKYVNTINFEHTYLLTEKVADFLLGKLGYKIREKFFFEGHSIFYCAEYVGSAIDTTSSLNYYDEYKKMYLDLIDYYVDEVVRLNKEIRYWQGDIYLFGAHIFSQFLIYMGLETDRIKGIIDNSAEKEGKRLYGTELIVNKPDIVVGKRNIMVIVKGGQYQKEIEEQLIDLSKDIKLCS